jgi:hypothetical protein
MAYRQPYRGNPELKQYHLINDFSGGLDTVSLDEKMRDNEFREMNNIELALQGSISNRKGFGELEHLNQWLEDKSVILPTGQINFLKVIRSENNVLNWANDYSQYSLFQTQMNNNIYNLQILFAVQVGVNVVFNLLTVQNTDGTSVNATVTLDSLLSVAGSIKPIYNIKTIQYVEKIYFLSYDVYETSDNSKKGICVYNLDDETLTVLTPSDTYIPTPIEVEEFGFNVLRANPLSDVSDQGFGDFAITGTYITDVDGRIIDLIPPSGNFNLSAFQIGATMTPQDIHLKVLNQRDVEIAYELLEVTDEGGYFLYKIRNAKLDAVTSITFKFESITEEDVETISLLTVPPGQVSLIDGDFVAISSDRTKLLQRNNVTTAGVFYTEAGYTEIPVIVVKDEIMLQLYTNNYFEDFYAYTTSTENYVFFDYSEDTVTTVTIDLSISTTEQLYLITDNIYSVVEGTDTLYYKYNGGTVGTIDDFDFYIVNEILPFTSLPVSIGIAELPLQVESLDLNGAKVSQIQDRLMIYKGNTIYFSEQFQYDYIPNRNFVLLPLNSTDEITHINFFRGVYIIFTRESIWRISGVIFGEDFTLVKVNDFIGCIAPNSVRALNNNLMFLSRQGLYALTQSYYQEGLENVKKVDEQISSIVELDENSYSVMYQEQYWLISDSERYSTLKYYFNINKSNGGHPFVTDTYRVDPDNLEVYNGVIYSIKNGHFYRYDRGYTDFFPRGANSSLKPDYMYNYRFVTKNDDLGYATHDKKIKSAYFKIRAGAVSELGVTIFVNEKAIIDPNTYTASVNEFGEVIYERSYDANLIVDPDATLGTFVLGKDTLGNTEVQIHKFLVSSKAKNISIAIEQSTDGYFNIEDIGFLYKLGKVKETR